MQFRWSKECQVAFENSKSLLSNAPVVKVPDFSSPFSLEIDASGLGVGAVLTQQDAEGLVHPVAYYSKKFNACQQHYSTIEQETLPLLLALQFFDVYVGASSVPVVVFTDHNPLVFLNRMYNHNQRLMRWALMLQGYNLIIRHKKGSERI